MVNHPRSCLENEAKGTVCGPLSLLSLFDSSLVKFFPLNAFLASPSFLFTLSFFPLNLYLFFSVLLQSISHYSNIFFLKKYKMIFRLIS